MVPARTHSWGCCGRSPAQDPRRWSVGGSDSFLSSKMGLRAAIVRCGAGMDTISPCYNRATDESGVNTRALFLRDAPHSKIYSCTPRHHRPRIGLVWSDDRDCVLVGACDATRLS